ncbi:MAG: bifunctional (p)ppGpp synthetase/guanosine-3',5'-bis(diphosphate) 3'-pyrophosphohydrolase [Bacteroidota bacterium]|nr:bifunctional (p)ppGpp synthetase/guanosine-3',5'-bis(diphosphate) 3'-pyrophosphohydrolase [Candidatus Kapabacteria bacterium]MCS7302585.1 bifunctional (p)ppGpp synthetase/guanosine-3',5'-bis(diphosphate) 3'-pyrophosphohydrolase [Candidatus Kapabacteria bacterium]MCX7936718.1 bifunctional (p)ppGpp synthetase/guanosine-3',5'-bis(diphosphate) 3'-pyrophosphohydrolase [Chlorobiota bacterium]MDW8074238.1 bifunctional (p)ppGpp synthetase/guanosine-3',5'-bis(diphosphate) 3'-pyrophosphohydrolase [Bact
MKLNILGWRKQTPGTVTTGVDPNADLELLLSECRKQLPRCNEALIRKAFQFCLQAHKNDLRESGEPYYTHPLEVARIIVNEIPLDDVSVCAALLHDVVEDTTYSLEDIRAEFGATVAEIVDGATKISGIFRSTEIRQAENYRKLLLALVKDVRVILIKFADRLHNMRTLGALPPERQKRIAQETLDIYAPFAHRFGLANLKWELEDLAFKYLNPEEYNKIKQALAESRAEREAYIERFAAPIAERLRKEGMQFEITGRPKHIYSIYQKMQRLGVPMSELYDLLAVRIILDTNENKDCYTVYGIVADIYEPIAERFKDYIARPKKNSYQSLHAAFIGPEGKRVEVQIRTRAMHEVAERGIAAHFRYKENQGNGRVPSWWHDKELEEWANWVRDIFENAGDEAPEQLLESFKLNLYQDEIYVYTPRNDLIILPKGATPIDFAYAIHSEIGNHCIGAKVNGKLVPLDYQLKTGDQVEILTSKNQHPTKDWERICVTHKARSNIRKYLNEEKRRIVEHGKQLWEKQLRKLNITIAQEQFDRMLAKLSIPNPTEFFYKLGYGIISIESALRLCGALPAEETTIPSSNPISTTSLPERLQSQAGVILDGVHPPIPNLLYHYARCCNPVPGDDIVGIITIGSGIKIHRRDCRNIAELGESMQARMVNLTWAPHQSGDYLATIRVTGEDRPGMLHDITNAITGCRNTNIRSVNIDAFGSDFEGIITLYVKDLHHLNEIFSRIRTIRGVRTVSRFNG